MKTFSIFSALWFLLAACSGAPAPAAPAAVALPESGPPGVEAIDPLTPSASDVQPAAAWNGIPIMPGATAGEGDAEGYVFTIQATPVDVQEFYEIELGKLGWGLAREDSDNATLALLFINSASKTLTISIVSKDGQALVLLAKQG